MCMRIRRVTRMHHMSYPSWADFFHSFIQTGLQVPENMDF